MTTQQHLLERAYGFSHNDVLKRATATRLIYALQPAAVTFSQRLPPPDDPHARIPAHAAGVNALTVDRFEGRYLLSGGADSSIAIWDLEAETASTESGEAYLPLSALSKTTKEHKLGITQLSFYPFDSLAFLTSSYDHTVKLYSSESLEVSASFDLDAAVYNIALSPIASHLLIACATQGPNVRLIDLRSGATTHSLAGHLGAVLSTAWSPVTDHLLASGATDGTVRFWDIRRSVGSLGSLDLEDSVGRAGAHTHSYLHASGQGQAHRGAVNGLVWTEDGKHLVSTGHDQRIRVWDTLSYANTLANFGPVVKNSGLAPVMPVLPPRHHFAAHAETMFYPSEHEILFYELFDGKLLRRMKRPEVAKRAADAPAGGANGNAKGQSNRKDRITSLTWRAHDVEVYSAHADGSICAWKPRTDEDVDADEDERIEEEQRDEGRKRKRDVLDDIYAGLTKKTITFGNMGL
ncbi:WD40 repeat-like protein [Didymella exigua CBS 183.55]|uniref:WD40 repeat-like protein n=1 Tax=Didymella exigua CBS 183.55 TaxID=1150837 RepID=A0A6A5RQI6_9PLEO|nr:WD40 repeat-like protein [Didymella exigua CBS 183.55]KAF1929590.1 WD40 repeat-like protein [Didymella exigua CBS 183.55]